MLGPPLDAYIYGFTFQKLNFPLDPSEYASTALQFLPLIPVEHFPFSRDVPGGHRRPS